MTNIVHGRVLKVLLKAGANPHEKSNKYGIPILVLAAKYGNKEMVQDLIACGADPLEKGDGELNAMEAAKENGHDHICKLLQNRSGNLFKKQSKKEKQIDSTATLFQGRN